MASPIIVFFTPAYTKSCSKLRQTLELLGEKNITPTIIEYLKNPPTAKKLKEILSQLGGRALRPDAKKRRCI